jgi:hypothetical protein
MIFFTNFGVPKQHQAATRGFVIFIRPEYRNDKGLLEHEKVHRKQWLRTLGLHSFMYLFSEDYRLRAEVEAFRAQLPHYPDDRRVKFAWLIAENYNLDITPDEALALLS